MSGHEHIWTPLEGEMRKYVCVVAIDGVNCGATGYKNKTGQIVPHKEPRKRREVSARGLGGPFAGMLGGGVGGNRRLGCARHRS